MLVGHQIVLATRPFWLRPEGAKSLPTSSQPSYETIISVADGTYAGSPAKEEKNQKHIDGCEQCKPIYDVAKARHDASIRRR